MDIISILFGEEIFKNRIKGQSRLTTLIRHQVNIVRSFFYLKIKNPWVKCHGMVRIHWSVKMLSPNKDIELGDNIQFGRGCLVNCDAKFGNKVLVANNVAFIGRDDHRFDVVGKTIWDTPRGDMFKVIVEDDVWIGHGAIILSGVTIGRGSVVAAGSLISKNVPRYSVVAGIPAKIIKKRFTEIQIREHEELLGYDNEI